MKICIRDDDLCYWSDFSAFKKLYDELDVPVSISLIPYAVANHGDFMPYGDDKPKNVSKCICYNKKLIKGIKQGIKELKYEVLLYGYSHQYKQMDDGGFLPEMIWKSQQELIEEIGKGKKIVEEALGVHVTTFVAPSQAINQKGIDVIAQYGMNFSGLAHGRGDRKKSIRLFIALFRRYVSRLLYGYALSPLIVYKTHKEQGILPILDLNSMIKYYSICKRHKWNFVVVTHYWQLLRDSELRTNLINFIKYIKEEEKQHFSFVSECY